MQALSPTDAWSVGHYCTSNCGKATEVDRSLILHWNGKIWSAVTGPNPSPARNTLYSVSAVSPTDAWAVGGYCTSNCSGGPTPPVDHTLILHWNGTAWSRVTSPSVTGADLHSIAELSTSNAWATGFGTPSNLMLHWNGTTWSKVTFPNQSPAFSVAFSSATDGWVVGFGGFIHWNGTQWSPLTVSTLPDSNLQAVSADSANDAWAVGFYCVSNCGTTSPVWTTEIMHWNGTSWIGQ